MAKDKKIQEEKNRAPLKVNYSRKSWEDVFVDIDFCVVFRDVFIKDVQYISVGDSQLDGYKRVIAKILKVEIVERKPLTIDLGGDNLISSPFPVIGGDDQFRKDIVAVVRLTGIIRGTTFYFADTPVKIYSEIDFNFGRYALTGMIIGICKNTQ